MIEWRRFRMARLCMAENETGSTATLDKPAESATSREDAAANAVLSAQEGGRVAPEKLAKAHDQVKAATTQAKRDESGKFKAEKAETHAPESKTDDKPKNDTAKGDTAQSRKAREDDALARHALRRDGLTDEDIDAMPQASRLLVGLKAKERQDRLTKELFVDPKSNPSNTRTAKGEEGEGKARTPEPSALLDAALPEPEADGPQAEGLERVLEALTDEQRELIAKTIEADRSKTAKQVAELEKQAKGAQVEVFKARMMIAESKLTRTYPALSDKARGAQVIEFIEKRMGIKRQDMVSYSAEDLHETLDTACAAVFGREAIKAANDQHVQALSDDLAGQPYMGGTKGSDPQSKVSREDIAARAVLKHPNDPDAARREMNRQLGV